MCHAYSVTTNLGGIRQMVQTTFRFDVAADPPEENAATPPPAQRDLF